MRRSVCASILGGICLLTTGCIVITGNKEFVKTMPGKAAVAVDGEVYIVDLDTKRAQRLDRASLQDAEVVTATAEIVVETD